MDDALAQTRTEKENQIAVTLCLLIGYGGCHVQGGQAKINHIFAILYTNTGRNEF